MLVSPFGSFFEEISKIIESNSCNRITNMAKGKEPKFAQVAEMTESMEDKFPSTQCLSIKVDSHSSNISFFLDTLAQHIMLSNQLHNEVDFLRMQGESLQPQLDMRTSPSESSVPEQDLGDFSC
jgi:hypothetical protein